MFKPITTFGGFSVDSLQQAKTFYIEKLGLKNGDETMGLEIVLPGGAKVFIYEKPDHQPATFTILNFVVSNIDEAMMALQEKGITFERYTLGNGVEQDEKGILRGRSANMGPDIAWFKDPAGNVLSIIQN